VVCYRYAPPGLDDARTDALNDAILAAVNADGRIMISATKLHGRTVLRLAIGNERTTREDVKLAWQILRETAATLGVPA
jgi:aromatic-L-amino-acid decarboxylase